MLIKYNDASYSTVWNAVAQSNVSFGRTLTTAESDAITNFKTNALNNGVIIAVPPGQTTTTYWSSETSATDYIALVSAFNPAPESASVVIPPVPLPGTESAPA